MHECVQIVSLFAEINQPDQTQFCVQLLEFHAKHLQVVGKLCFFFHHHQHHHRLLRFIRLAYLFVVALTEEEFIMKAMGSHPRRCLCRRRRHCRNRHHQPSF